MPVDRAMALRAASIAGHGAEGGDGDVGSLSDLPDDEHLQPRDPGDAEGGGSAA